ncbi:MAB_1171c family putative transporter [Streptomyces sp. NBC_00525]|uniref:MAB_1171c family putative transporter n=1 Tax=Streptomyces sp. NBC_00525 TaxID=2903660 RepID=UPI002E803191|nr:MAB_1171c family putative transporter [Streptomyces sp. NBC_00525]WUC94830.1 hypothetical protein OG710_15150 [Streptomyces sp. NBC_00525]
MTYVPYSIPAVLLAIALFFKIPTFIRAWRNPEVRATTLLLVWASAAFVTIIPLNIERLNDVTGVPNIAAPWAYSFLTASGATSLAMIMRWSEEPSEDRRRKIRRIHAIYTGMIGVLWVTFFLADTPDVRIHDLDTYYAGTPWMREHILLYLLAHFTTCSASVFMLWKWFKAVKNPWLKSGVVFLQGSFVMGLAFGTSKLTAITARWSGADWDWLSTRVAPHLAILEGALAAVGFITPQAGPVLKRWNRNRREYRRLRPLWRAVFVLAPAAATARLGYWVPLELRVLQRRQRIHDSLRLLAPYYNTDLYHQAYTEATATYTEPKARAIAGAVAIRDAIAAYNNGTPISVWRQSPQIGTEITDRIDAVSVALDSAATVNSLHQRATRTGTMDTHA